MSQSSHKRLQLEDTLRSGINSRNKDSIGELLEFGPSNKYFGLATMMSLCKGQNEIC